MVKVLVSWDIQIPLSRRAGFGLAAVLVDRGWRGAAGATGVATMAASLGSGAFMRLFNRLGMGLDKLWLIGMRWFIGWKMILGSVVKTVDAGKLAFRGQFSLRLQPVLYFVPVPRAFVYVREVGPSGNFVWIRRKIQFSGIQTGSRSRLRGFGRLVVLIVGMVIMFHKLGVDWSISFFSGRFSASARCAASVELATCNTELLPPNGLATISLACGSVLH